MKVVGALLFIVGVFWILVAFNMDTTVLSGGKIIGDHYVPYSEVYNIGKMDDRRTHLMLAALVIVIGVILFVLENPPIHSQYQLSELSNTPETKNCPYCAEIIKAEAKVCRFCQRDVPQQETIKQGSASSSEQAIEQLRQNGYILDKATEGWKIYDPAGNVEFVDSQATLIEYASKNGIEVIQTNNV